MLNNILAIILGLISGIFTGLTPGIHINLITAILMSSSITGIGDIDLIIFIISLAITHTFVDFIPSIYLGAASEDTINSMLPGHKFLLSGEGHKAVKLTILGSTIAVISLLIVVPVLFLIINTTYNFIERMMGFTLIVIIIFLIMKEKQSKVLAIIIFFLAGVIGTITLNSQINEPLLPLLTGLFGASTIINSLTKRTKIPQQRNSKIKTSFKESIRPTIKTIIISPLCSLLPGLGASQAATIASSFSKEKNDKEYLILLGSINTLVLATSFFTLYLIGKTRTGAANTISQILTVTPQILLIIITTIVVTTILIIPITIIISKTIAKRIHRINYHRISLFVLIGLTTLITYISGFSGLLIYLTSTTLGLFTIKKDLTRSHLMGAILLPTTLYYLPFF